MVNTKFHCLLFNFDLLPVVGLSSNLVFVRRIDDNGSIVRENSITCSEAVTFENEKQPPDDYSSTKARTLIIPRTQSALLLTF